MSMRVTQSTMYSNMVSNMQKSLSAYMETMEQGSSQMKINRPSDDPAGTFRAMMTRNEIAQTEQLKQNIDTALGWLTLADNVLSSQVPNVLTSLKTLAEQGATGTYTADQRMMMADEARAYFGQIMNLANTRFEGKSIFAGHKYDTSAYQQGWGLTTWDENFIKYPDPDKPGVFLDKTTDKNDLLSYSDIITNSDRTVMVQFYNGGGAGGGELKGGESFRISNDGGKNWYEGTVKTEQVTVMEVKDGIQIEHKVDNLVIEADNAPFTFKVTLRQYRSPADPLYDETKNFTDPANKINWNYKYAEGDSVSATNGTMLYVRPAAFYQGDDNDPPAQVTVMPNNTRGNVSFVGDNDKFKDATVTGRIDKAIRVTITGVDEGTGKVKYEYYALDDPKQNKILGESDGLNKIYVLGAAIELARDEENDVDKLLGAGDVDTVFTIGTPATNKFNGARVQGTFPGNTLVRIDATDEKTKEFNYSYSTDEGVTWVQLKGKLGDRHIVIPGGYIDLDPFQKTPRTEVELGDEGTQFLVHASRADLNYEVMPGISVAVNNVGKDIFGGIYVKRDERDDHPIEYADSTGHFDHEGQTLAQVGENDLFEVLGEFIGYLETNNQEGCQKVLAAITQAEKSVLSAAATIGGRETTVNMAQDWVTFTKLDLDERLSYIEDIDLTELLTRLTRQQITYQTILQSSSQIMNLSLANYV